MPFNIVNVCWENPTPQDATERAWVRRAIETTWQKYSRLEFTGWKTCTDANRGIRILIKDGQINDGPHVKALGKYLRGKENGMELNFKFSYWSTSCATPAKRKDCITSIAVHEFGHAIGFAHEQNRPDTPGDCMMPPQGTSGDTTALTPWDKDSVMNYCNTRYNNDGKLSKFDIKALQYIYGKR